MSTMNRSNFLLFILLLLCATASAQKQNVYFIKDNGQYVDIKDSADFVRVVQEPEKDSELFIVKEYYNNGKMKSIGLSAKIDPPRYEGTYRTLYKNGNKKQIATFVKGVLSGSVYNYYPNGQLYNCFIYSPPQPGSNLPSYKISLVNDSTGKSLVTNGNGTAAFYDDDFKHITGRGNIKNGEYDGVWTGEDPKQYLTYKETYEEGKLLSGESTDGQGETTNYTKPFIEPEFKGGIKNFYRYLSQNVRYPPNCQRMGIQGTVYLNFVVEKDGKLNGIKVINYVNEELGAEALRVLKRSPLWTPGMMRGRKVRVVYNVPVSFSLN
jgi:TonB family protein